MTATASRCAAIAARSDTLSAVTMLMQQGYWSTASLRMINRPDSDMSWRARRVQPGGYPRAQCRYIDQGVRHPSTGAVRRPARPAGTVIKYLTLRGDVVARASSISAGSGSPPRAGTSRSQGGREMTTMGSPPRARGRPGIGISDSRAQWAHPRVRGDVASDPLPVWQRRGSPPRARGEHATGVDPACCTFCRPQRRPPDISGGTQHPAPVVLSIPIRPSTKAPRYLGGNP